MAIQLFIVVLFALCTEMLQAQDNGEPAIPQRPKVPFKDRLFTGGNIGLQFGTITYIDVSPKLGYKITEQFAAGIGATYIYLKDKSYPNFSYQTDIYGGRVFSQYQLLENVLAYSEFEVLNAEVYNDFTATLKREYISSLLAGGGYSQSFGGNSSAVILVLFNLLESRYSFYQNPVIRIGFNIGF